MTVRLRHWSGLGAALVALVSWMALGACGPHTVGGGGDGSVGDGYTGDGHHGDGGVMDAGPECHSNDDCDGGVCVSGSCCPTVEQVCGSACCETTQVCFGNACVTPGGICHSTADCAEGQYCEFGLNDEDGGVPDAGPTDGSTCLRPAPAGRCVDLPPRCDADGGVPDGGLCIPNCEYHPSAGGPLSVRTKWSWNPDTVVEYQNSVDVWATPAVGRFYDTNCDGVVDDLDPPNIIFVSGNARRTCCSCGGYTPSTCKTGVLRVLDGLTGQEIWSLRRAESGSVGFAGLSVALGDVDRDGAMDIVAATGEGKLVIVDATGTVTAISDHAVSASSGSFGWGGGIAIADMDGDGWPEVALGNVVFTTASLSLNQMFAGDAGIGRAWSQPLSLFADLDGAADGHLELLAGNTAYKTDGSHLWYRSDLHDGFDAVADLDEDGKPDVVLVASGEVYILEGSTGQTKLGPATLPGTGFGGPPTVADFDGDGHPEIGVAQANFYTVLKPDFNQDSLDVMWHTANHDLSSSVTGSTVFDFEGDGAAEVVYNDECFLWVFDGTTGGVRFAALTTSFTATESSLLADVDGDGHAEMVMIANGADPSSSGWQCDIAPWNQPGPNGVRPAWVAPSYGAAYRGITVFGDTANSWVGTRTLWNEHTYHVTNICDPRDSACASTEPYGAIPQHEKTNWTQPWLNNFRQNVQDKGLFNAPDATVTLLADCIDPVKLHAYVRNLGAALLPSGVTVGFYVRENGQDRLLDQEQTTTALFPGQLVEVVYETQAQDNVDVHSTFVAKIEIDPQHPTFHECRDDNNDSGPVLADCDVIQ